MKRLLIVVSLITFLLLTIQTVRAASDTPYIMDWWTVDSGGGNSSSDTYTLSGTIGQADPGTLGGGGYSLEGGFWVSLQEAWKVVFLPLIHRP
jgi:hypothetical protein